MGSIAPPAMRVLAMSRVVPEWAPQQVEDPGPVKVKLSFLDVQLITRLPIQQVFLYKLASADEFPSAIRRLKESLAAALAVFLPLAGKLVYAEETGDVVVDCSDPGVAFFEAEVADGDSMDVRRLAGDEAQDNIPKFLSLMPEFDARVLPAPVLSVQATWLGAGGGGLALATCLHHAVIDGRALWRFIDLWASVSRGSPHVAKSLGTLCYSREAIATAHPRGDELAREILKKVAPNLPVLISPFGTTKLQANKTDHYFSRRSGLAWRRFYLSAHDIRSLKQSINRLAAAEAGGARAALRPVSTFVALSALCWTSFVRSKYLAPEHNAYLAFPIDLRARLHPPVSDGYVGVCINKCLASANAGDLLGDAGLLHASRAIQEAVREADATPLAGTEVAWTERVMHVPTDHLAVVAGCPLSYRLYETADFGFGKPALVDDVPLNHDGRMLLSAGMRDGQVQISGSLNQAHMGAFKAHITGGPRARI